MPVKNPTLMLVKAISPAELRMGPFIVELVLGQFIFIESFALLYPGFVAVDSYRDLWISQSIIANAGERQEATRKHHEHKSLQIQPIGPVPLGRTREHGTDFYEIRLCIVCLAWTI